MNSEETCRIERLQETLLLTRKLEETSLGLNIESLSQRVR